jgi:hypothetical protein
MKEKRSEPNRNENLRKHRFLSWCSEHKMQFIPIVLMGIILLGGVGYMLSQESYVEVNLEWTSHVR